MAPRTNLGCPHEGPRVVGAVSRFECEEFYRVLCRGAGGSGCTRGRRSLSKTLWLACRITIYRAHPWSQFPLRRAHPEQPCPPEASPIRTWSSQQPSPSLQGLRRLGLQAGEAIAVELGYTPLALLLSRKKKGRGKKYRLLARSLVTEVNVQVKSEVPLCVQVNAPSLEDLSLSPLRNPQAVLSLQGLRRLGLQAGEAIAVEDSLAGVQVSSLFFFLYYSRPRVE